MKRHPPFPAETPRIPDDSAPTAMEHTPAHGAIGPMGVAPYVRAKLAEARRHTEDVARAAAEEAARAAAREAGRPVLPKALTPWFLAGFTMCGSITTVAMSFEGAIPRPLLVAAAVGSMFFGAMLGIGPGLRK